MSHFPLTAPRPPGPAPAQSRAAPPAAWAGRPEAAGPAVAVLMTGCPDPAAAARGYRTVLPRAQIVLYGPSLAADEVAAAEAAGAAVRDVPPCTRDALVRRMFAEVDADIYILAHGAGPEDVCVAPLVVAEVDGGRDLVDVRRVADAPPDAPGRFLAATVDFAFGGHGDVLRSDFKACSRRFALSYRRTPHRAGRSASSARDLALHALRLRLPIGRVAALASGGGSTAPGIPAVPASLWAEALGIAARLLVEERPRRVLGLLGIGVMVLGLALAAPELRVHRWHAVLAPGARALSSAALLASGAALGAAGLMLDALASARQEIRRHAAAAIPRRAERPPADPRARPPVIV